MKQYFSVLNITVEELWVFNCVWWNLKMLQKLFFDSSAGKKGTVIPNILEYILLNTAIVSDGWASCGEITLLEGYNHKILNYSLYFVLPDIHV